MTLEGNISLTELLKRPIPTAQHGDGENRIASTTEALKQAAHRFVDVLNERAMLLANSAQFDRALHDAAAIRAMLPGSGLGYLCTGDVYCQQGHHAAAISIYDQGLEAAPESDPYHQQLQQQREKAIANNNKRVDFISKLPLDIVITNILPRMKTLLFSHSLYEPLYVSRAWQKRILQQPHGLDFHFNQEEDSFKSGHDQLVRFAPYVQSLQGGIMGDVRLDDLFTRARFSNLKELVLQCDPETPRLPLIHGLQLIADSLTRLTLFECRDIQLRDILETCPNLEFLKATDVDAFMPLSPSTIYPKMKHLALYQQPTRARKHENMVDVLRRFPSLRVLEISPMPDSSLLPILHKSCPYLQVLFYELVSQYFGTTATKIHPNREGITSAYLGGDDFYHQDDLIEFLCAQRNSLEILDFRGTHEIENALWELSTDGRVLPQRSTSLQENNDPSSSVTFTRLIDLRFIDINPLRNMPMILWIVLNAPNLNAIHIFNSHFKPDVAKALIKLKQLRKVEIEHNDVRDMNDNIIHDNYEGIHQFFEYHAALGDHSTLEHVAVLMDSLNASKQTWLPLLPQLRCLKILEIRGEGACGDCVIAKNCIPIIERIRQYCPSLKKLVINGERRV